MSINDKGGGLKENHTLNEICAILTKNMTTVMHNTIK